MPTPTTRVQKTVMRFGTNLFFRLKKFVSSFMLCFIVHAIIKKTDGTCKPGSVTDVFTPV
jgi:hypothetical protein